MSKHNITRATSLYWGDAYDANVFNTNERNGVPWTPVTKISLGSPAALDVNGIVDGATSTELPNTTTITYTTADDGTTPFDNADTPAISTIVTSTGASASVWPLDVPRNLSLNVTHASSIVAMSCTVTGYDYWKKKVVETMSVTATGTTKTSAGLKAFAYIESIAFTSAGDATTNTANLGWADVLGLPYYVANKSDVFRVFFNDTIDDSATVVAGVTTTATATTGDVRGTVDTNSAADGSAVVVYASLDPSTATTLLGVAQYEG